MTNMDNIDNEIRIQSLNWDVGIHTSFEKRIVNTLRIAIGMGTYSTQFFMGSPKSYNRQRISDNDIEESNRLLDRFPMNVFTHFPYIANLNGSVSSLAWNGDSKIDTIINLMLNELQYELETISRLNSNVTGVVIHPGCYPDRVVGLQTIAKTINKIEFNGKAKLLLENCAGEGRKLCKNFSEFKLIYNSINKEKLNNVGFCVDTAHIWGEGLYDLSSIDEVKRMFIEFDNEIGIKNLTLIHLNDSEVPFGSKKDRHSVLGTGYIWGRDISSLIYLLDYCKENSIPMILETNCMSMCVLHELESNLIKY
jgi:deoxyribonuclease-4